MIARRDELISRASQKLRTMSHHTGGTLRLDAYNVQEIMQEIIRAVDSGEIA